MDNLDMPNTISINPDAFTSGQISSKIWLCEQLEQIKFDKPQVVWVYGGWYGMMSFLLLSRNNIPIKHIRSFDIDPSAESIADLLLENWIWQGWKFKAFTADCNQMNFTNEKPTIIINCSVEHFEDTKWVDDIPQGTLLVLQSNNMSHATHVSCVSSLAEFEQQYDLDLKFSGKLDFEYPAWQFSRYMLIGYKN